MKFLCLIYNDLQALKQLPEGKFDDYMRQCIQYDDELRAKGRLVSVEKLAPVETAVTLRTRNGKLTTTDGPFAETKEILGGFQLIEAKDMAEAIEIAARIPWHIAGSIEIRPVEALPTYG
jgi:hypothetical protein